MDKTEEKKQRGRELGNNSLEYKRRKRNRTVGAFVGTNVFSLIVGAVIVYFIVQYNAQSKSDEGKKRNKRDTVGKVTETVVKKSVHDTLDT